MIMDMPRSSGPPPRLTACVPAGLHHRAQIAKNIVLAGVGNVALLDDAPASAFTGLTFLVTAATPTEVRWVASPTSNPHRAPWYALPACAGPGQPKRHPQRPPPLHPTPGGACYSMAQAAAATLQAMNPLVSVTAVPGPASSCTAIDLVKGYDLVIVTGGRGNGVADPQAEPAWCRGVQPRCTWGVPGAPGDLCTPQPPPLPARHILPHSAVSPAGQPLDIMQQADAACRQAGAGFMAASARAFSSFLFVDLGTHTYRPKVHRARGGGGGGCFGMGLPCGNCAWAPTGWLQAAPDSKQQAEEQMLHYPSMHGALSVPLPQLPAGSHPLYLVLAGEALPWQARHVHPGMLLPGGTAGRQLATPAHPWPSSAPPAPCPSPLLPLQLAAPLSGSTAASLALATRSRWCPG